MNKLSNEMINLEILKIMINSSYGMSGVSMSLYDELISKKQKFFKIQNRVLKVKRLFNGI